MSTDFLGSPVTHTSAEGPSNRSFGLTVGGILLMLGVVRCVARGNFDLLADIMLAIGGALLLLGILLPGSLSKANRAWMMLGVLMGRVMSPIILLLVYVFAFVPVGILMRLKHHDPLRRKRSDAESYWIEREATNDPARGMLNQF
ncbi:SxtJ family membrane protein [Allomesorhizobium camelthorni]|uniref:SxtJ family membrane protein n=1 Tax=Allomesorhizobium camelthorni TaxID=475069 RepID=UPI0031B5E28D